MTTCHTSDGKAKKRFLSRAAAKQARARYAEEGWDVSEQKPYRCRQCGWFHLGHYPSEPEAREYLRWQHRHRKWEVADDN